MPPLPDSYSAFETAAEIVPNEGPVAAGGASASGPASGPGAALVVATLAPHAETRRTVAKKRGRIAYSLDKS